MLLDLTKYRVQKQEIIRAYDRARVKDVVEIIALCAPGIHTPNVVLAYYLAEDIGFTPELLKSIESLIKYCGYTSVKGLPENAPSFGLKIV